MANDVIGIIIWNKYSKKATNEPVDIVPSETRIPPYAIIITMTTMTTKYMKGAIKAFMRASFKPNPNSLLIPASPLFSSFSSAFEAFIKRISLNVC